MTDTPAFKSYYFWKLKREIDDVKEREKKSFVENLEIEQPLILTMKGEGKQIHLSMYL